MKNTEKDLRLYFELLGLSLEDWGKGDTKTVRHLVRELNKRECRINGVFREVHTVVLDVVHDDEKLREVCQVFTDGRIRERTFRWGSVGEKLKLQMGERPIRGLWRALKEELGLRRDPQIVITSVGADILLAPSVSYPGLFTKNVQVRFKVSIPKHLYRPDGYFENQRDKTTYFEWVPRSKE